MFAHSVMDVVFVLNETINPSSISWRLEKACGESYGELLQKYRRDKLFGKPGKWSG